MKMDGRQRSSRMVVATFWQIWRPMLFICFISTSAFAADANNINNPSSFSFLRDNPSSFSFLRSNPSSFSFLRDNPSSFSFLRNNPSSFSFLRNNPSSFSFLRNNRKALVGTAASKIFNVESYGAKGDGVTDNQKAFSAAWAAACNDATSTKTLIVPAGKTYPVSPITFTGPCNGKLYFQIDGMVIAPLEMTNVQNPIIIDHYHCDRRRMRECHGHTTSLTIVDQNHCDRRRIKDCHNHSKKAVQISVNSMATSSTKDAISLKCSNSASCSNLVNLAHVSAAADVSSFAKQDAKNNAKSVHNNVDDDQRLS